MEISVVIPLVNEAESLSELHQWIDRALTDFHDDLEIIFIDDGSHDDSWLIIEQLSKLDQRVKGIRFLRNFGKSQALHAGFSKAQGKFIVTMDADLQDNPEEIPHMITMLKKDGFDMVSGWKKKRYDSYLWKNLPSKLFNFIARKTSGISLNDFNCGLKAYKMNVIRAIEVRGEMHRYIPVLVKNAGFSNIGEHVVRHQARKYGSTKFGSERFIRGFLDLVTISFISRFGKRPMHFFGTWGAVMLILGFLFSAYLGLDKLFFNTTGRLITERPEFYIALTAMILGGQFFIAGFLGELILRVRQAMPDYHIKESLNL